MQKGHDLIERNRLRRILWIGAIGVCCVCSQCFSQNKVEVIISEVKDGTGMIRVGLFADEHAFLKKPIQGRVLKSVGGQQTVVFESVPSGSFAISVIHDSNENGKLDTNFFGIPKEGIGFSNDAMGSFGPPSFEKARFTVSTAVRLTIKMRYL